MSNPTLEEQLFTEVYVPEFIEKCASHGVDLKTEEDIQVALKMAAQLEMAETTENSSLLKNASAKLDQMVLGVQASNKPSAFMARAMQYVP